MNVKYSTISSDSSCRRNMAGSTLYVPISARSLKDKSLSKTGCPSQAKEQGRGECDSILNNLIQTNNPNFLLGTEALGRSGLLPSERPTNPLTGYDHLATLLLGYISLIMLWIAYLYLLYCLHNDRKCLFAFDI